MDLSTYFRLSPSARRVVEKELAPQSGAFGGEAVYSVTEAAWMAGVDPVTIRRAEKAGRLPEAKRAANGNRHYSHAEIEHITATLGNH